MPKKKIVMLLLTLFQAQYSIACEGSRPTENNNSHKKTEFKTYSNDIPPGLKIPIDLLINEDTEQPGTEPGIDYKVYTTKKGNHWPDWDWDGEPIIEKSPSPITHSEPPIQAEPLPTFTPEQRCARIMFCCYGHRDQPNTSIDN